MELFSMININAFFLLIFYSDNGSSINYTNIKILLLKLLKLIKYIYINKKSIYILIKKV